MAELVASAQAHDPGRKSRGRSGGHGAEPVSYTHLILFYAASALLYMASLISFISGNDNSMAVVWLCLGSSFLCLGSTHLCLGLSRKKKGNDKTDASNK